MTRREPDRERWLAAASTGGFPEPVLRRWQPLRVGIVNLWEYDQAEFWFADGRLVLRGGNGAGKTKVLELTTLMLLRGEIGASVLDPFGSQHRTMRFNLLPTGEDDDPRPPSDAGLGYAWAEYGRVDDDGTARFFVCGLGVSARRGSGTSAVTTWHLITHLRPGRDFKLAAAGRPLDQKELKKVPGVSVPDSAARYRARLAAELFGLGTGAYDNLTELLKQLRKPKLGERLNPASLAETLRAALPPLAGTEITQLADGWDNLEKLRTAVEQTRTAAVRLAGFVRTGWTPWARAVVRRRADALTAATTELDGTTKDRRSAETALGAALGAVGQLEESISRTRSRQLDLGTELRELLDSQAFQDAVSVASRVEVLREQLAVLAEQLGGVEDRRASAAQDAADAAEAAEEATSHAGEAETAVERAAGRVRETGQPAGLQDSAARHLPARDVAALRADLSVRRERFARLQALRATFDQADQEVVRSAETLAGREADLVEAAEQRARAEEDVAAAVEALRERIRAWNTDAVLAKADEHTVERWCDLVADLTADPSGSPGDRRGAHPSSAIAQHVERVRDTLWSRRTELDHQRAGLVEEHQQATAQLADVLGRAERPPAPPDSWRRRDRPEPDRGLGAPFWRCVQPVDGLSTDEVDLLEATLAAAGVLDAWLTADGEPVLGGSGPADTLVHAGGTHVAANLTEVLEPTPVGGVPETAVRAVLAAIGWHAARPGDDEAADLWLAADGTWRCAALSGRAEVVRPASYLGATARESARQREIDRLRTRLAELETSTGAVDAGIEDLDRDLRRLAEESAGIPAERSVTDTVTTLRERERRAAESERKAAKARNDHRARETARDTARADLAYYAGEHAFPVENLSAHEAALHAYRQAVDELAGRSEVLGLRSAALARARRDLTAAQRRLAEVDAELDDLSGRRRQAEVRLHTAEAALTTDVRARLLRRTELDGLVQEAERDLEDQRKALTDARIAATRAEETLARHEDRRRAAEHERDLALARWWEVHDAGLARPLGLEEPERRSVESARESTRAARRELPDAGDEDRAWRTCYSKLDDLRRHLLPDRDARVSEPDHDGGIQRVLVLTDSTAGWQAPADAASLLARQVQAQEASFDAEQQRVLTTLLGSTFIEHLKERLDYTARTFSDINKQLASHTTRHGNAVQLKWEPDPTDPDAGAVVDALSQGYQQLSSARQDTVRSFLARRIDAARADAAAGGSADWREQLSAALDYRGWLKISLQHRPGSTSRWTPFDTAKHGAKSGGEKVVLLSQPLFAAAVVAYNAAGGHAPRCVWLDEAMTGVDEEIKASFMGLTVNFDLDVMLTAHDEWCKYPTVPAVAVYDLARHRGLPGVDAVPYLWCGGDWTAVALPTTDDAPLPADGLFAEADVE
ncbi:TIGR02680 family protein [Saccharothrix australiensis]|uniref:Uncharacterized protein (TIGR02680 family) n=1 Tax=Saccharothrix australiensis TaxID=2072 RepID=A0A495W1F7_9PSEU|nr:TIGR02680 family protein [Saccharothrix australiensis]RKT55521.1 uncharacterized protein (TIGR02680 family) [Saccharothrix australiensis]